MWNIRVVSFLGEFDELSLFLHSVTTGKSIGELHWQLWVMCGALSVVMKNKMAAW